MVSRAARRAWLRVTAQRLDPRRVHGGIRAGLRDRAMLMLLAAGLRPEEIVELVPGRVEALPGGTARLRLLGAGPRRSHVILDEGAAHEVLTLAEALRADSCAAHAPLICGRGGRAMTPGAIRQKVKRLSRAEPE